MERHEIKLSASDELDLRYTRQYYPYRKIAGVKTADGEFTIFANPTMAKANAYARKTGGALFILQGASK